MRRILIAGAGVAGRMVLEEIRRNQELEREVVGFVDDDPAKDVVEGVRVLGSTDEISNLAGQHKIDEVIIAMPSASGETIRKITARSADVDAELRIVPGIREIIEGDVQWEQVRDIKPEDLLGRDVVEVDRESLADFFRAKTVMITGAAGSIGSELTQFLLELPVRTVAGLDNNESGLYELYASEISSSVRAKFDYFLGDIRDKKRLEEVVARVEPDVVFHAAALKHVPVLENNPGEAVKTNLAGSMNLFELLADFNVQDCVVISTDKAVAPRGIMGMTKRVNERLVSTYQRRLRKTRSVAVRFGNVLGSRGSVVPLFKNQIESGGPVTVTDPEVVRYFMTPGEAVKLVSTAASFVDESGLYLLEMGDPVKILDLARQLIVLSGYRPGRDIEIEYTGLRDGEKKAEKLVWASEEPGPTEHPDISRVEPGPLDKRELERLRALVDSPPADQGSVTGQLRELI